LEKKMNKTIAMLCVMLGVAGFAMAGTPTTPEIDAASGIGAITLLSGAVLVLRARRKK
jgi:hypothetical protein